MPVLSDLSRCACGAPLFTFVTRSPIPGAENLMVTVCKACFAAGRPHIHEAHRILPEES